MKKERLLKLLPYAVCFFIAGSVTWLYISLRDLEGLPLVEQYRILCDAFTAPGVIFLVLGLLMTISNTGALDGISYALKYMVKMLVPGVRDPQEKYLDYVEHARANRKKGFGCLYVTGITFMAVSMVFLALFYSVFE